MTTQARKQLRTGGVSDLLAGGRRMSVYPWIMHSSGSHTQNPKCQRIGVTRPRMQPIKKQYCSQGYHRFIVTFCFHYVIVKNVLTSYSTSGYQY
jgi:hypothetical protein